MKTDAQKVPEIKFYMIFFSIAYHVWKSSIN